MLAEVDPPAAPGRPRIDQRAASNAVILDEGHDNPPGHALVAAAGGYDGH